MNTANLQLRGLLLAMAQINNALVQKGVLSIDELDDALGKAEANLMSEEGASEDLSPSNRDAVCFPIRLLQAAIMPKAEPRSPLMANSPAWSAKRSRRTIQRIKPQRSLPGFDLSQPSFFMKLARCATADAKRGLQVDGFKAPGRAFGRPCFSSAMVHVRLDGQCDAAWPTA
jgi:hypothetical protein